MREMLLEQGTRGSTDMSGVGLEFVVMWAVLSFLLWASVEIITGIVEFVKKKCRKKEEKP
ncbi:MAG: hypothetical protein FWG65_03765 [Turicibacter sp.]|nr:hypothetical protein [Turicibacter sp.]